MLHLAYMSRPRMTLIALAVSATIDPACALEPSGPSALDSVHQGIVGGQVASPSEFPTVVAIEDALLDVPFCSGTLIDRSWVMTAAHCIRPPGAGFDFDPGDLQIIFDDPDVSDLDDGPSAQIAEIHVHPDYDENVIDHDIALVKLRMPVTDRAPTSIARTAIPPNTRVTIVGYGVEEDALLPGVLHSLATRTSDCATAGNPAISGDRVLCFDNSRGAGTSDGDSGGPTFIDVGGVRTVVGATSDASGHFDFNTLVPHELGFIDQFVPVVGPPSSGDDGSAGGEGAGSAGSPGGAIGAGCSVASGRRLD